MPTDFEPSRLVLARRRAGFSVAGLARACALTAQTVHNLESGRHQPTDASTGVLAIALGVDGSFFYGDSVEDIEPSGVSFRARSKMSARARNSGIATGQLSELITAALRKHFRVPDLDVPTLDGDVSPRLAADYVRSRWGLRAGDPAPNLVHLLEAHGVAVYSIPNADSMLDAFSFWRDRQPYVLLSTNKSAERSRFDAAHELGHLVMHHNIENLKGRQIEQEANKFAGNFLMPAVGVRRNIRTNPALAVILQEKLRWGVSATALTYRLHELELLTEWSYKSNLISLGGMGYRNAEPMGVNRERSMVFQKVLASRHGRDAARVLCSEASLDVSLLSDLTFGLVPTVVMGGAEVQVEGAEARRKLRSV